MATNSPAMRLIAANISGGGDIISNPTGGISRVRHEGNGLLLVLFNPPFLEPPAITVTLYTPGGDDLSIEGNSPEANAQVVAVDEFEAKIKMGHPEGHGDASVGELAFMATGLIASDHTDHDHDHDHDHESESVAPSATGAVSGAAHPESNPGDNAGSQPDDERRDIRVDHLSQVQGPQSSPATGQYTEPTTTQPTTTQPATAQPATTQPTTPNRQPEAPRPPSTPLSLDQAIATVHTAANKTYLFVKNDQGELWVNGWTGQCWQWQNLGRTIASSDAQQDPKEQAVSIPDPESANLPSQPDAQPEAQLEAQLDAQLENPVASAALTAHPIVIAAKDFARDTHIEVGGLEYGDDIIHNAWPYQAQTNSVEYDIACDAPGDYELWVEYAASELRPVAISVNNHLIKADGLSELTGGWYSQHQAWHRQCLLSLQPGMNILKLYQPNGFPHIRALKLLPVEKLASTAIEG